MFRPLTDARAVAQRSPPPGGRSPPPTGGSARGWIVSALDGRVLLENDLVRYDAFSYRVFADPETKLAGSYVMNRQDIHLIGDPRSRRLINAAYESL